LRNREENQGEAKNYMDTAHYAYDGGALAPPSTFTRYFAEN